MITANYTGFKVQVFFESFLLSTTIRIAERIPGLKPSSFLRRIFLPTLCALKMLTLTSPAAPNLT